MARSIAAFLEKHEEPPEDLDAWLQEFGIDPSKPVQRKVDADGWTWWFQTLPDPPESL